MDSVEVEVEDGKVVSVQYAGPIPPPQMLGEYDNVVPGSAKQLLAEFKKESAHRREMEALFIKAKIDDQKKSQKDAFYAVMGFLCVVALAIIFNQPWIAALFGAGIIASVVKALKQKK